MPSQTSASKAYTRRRWLFITAVGVQLLVACISIVLMTSVRVVVGGESLWSKGFNAAALHLNQYAETGNTQDFLDFQDALTTPLGVGQAREALDEGDRHSTRIRTGLLQGENHPDDVDTLLYALPWVWTLDVLAPTLTIWRSGDAHVQALNQLGKDIYNHRNSGRPVTHQTIASWHEEINNISTTVVPLAKKFNATLASNARDLEWLLIFVNIFTAALLCTMHWLAIQKAIVENRKTSSKLETERQRSSTTLAALGDGVLNLDEQHRIRYANPSASRLLDLSQGHLLGQDIQTILPFATEVLVKHLAGPKQPGMAPRRDDSVHWIRRTSGDNVAVHVSATTLDGENSGTVVVLHDVSQEQNYMRMLQWQQSHDLLTGLDNRATFEKYLQQVLGKHQASLLHLNLDHFKMINASYGHAAGDEILRQVCQQLRLVLRESDVLARVGGDEFAVLLTHCPPHASMQSAERLRQSIHNLNVQWRQHNLHTGVSIGVVHIDPQQSSDPASLLGMAESACKHAKESGRNRITVYNPHDRAFQRYQGDMEWVQRLRNSLEEDKFTLFAQTVYPLHPEDQGGVHFEVLLRLSDVPGQQLSPSEFIPIAERYDLMNLIDRWVVRHALQLLKTHLAQGADIRTCSINLSGSSLGDSDLTEFIRQSILEFGIAGDKLCFEITETSAIASMDSAIAMITELRKLGCRFSLDDFGSGMASFRYLQQLPVDYLKIDGSFVRDMLKNPSNFAMVEAIGHIGHVMGKSTVAEFVGDQATFDALRSMGIDYAQGYYIATPVPLDTTYFQHAHQAPQQHSRATATPAPRD